MIFCGFLKIIKKHAVVNFFFFVGLVFGVFLVPKIVPRLVQNLLIFGLIFFFGGVELFGCLLGAFLGLLRLSWDASGPKNV